VVATNTPDVLTETTADFGFALLMATARRMAESEHFLRAGLWTRWSYDMFAGAEIHGSTLGIIGMGRIGQGIARRGALGFGMKVLYCNRKPLDAATEAACQARRDDAFVVCARTDAIAVEGIEAACRRARAYADAGADMIFADAVRSEEDIAAIVEAARVPVTVNMGFGIRSRPTTPLFPIPRLKALGVRRISLPRMLPAAAVHAMQQALTVMREVMTTGVPADRPDLLASIEDIMALMGYAEQREREARLLHQDAPVRSHA
jgi:hypothetical protein